MDDKSDTSSNEEWTPCDEYFPIKNDQIRSSLGTVINFDNIKIVRDETWFEERQKKYQCLKNGDYSTFNDSENETPTLTDKLLKHTDGSYVPDMLHSFDDLTISEKDKLPLKSMGNVSKVTNNPPISPKVLESDDSNITNKENSGLLNKNSRIKRFESSSSKISNDSESKSKKLFTDKTNAAKKFNSKQDKQDFSFRLPRKPVMKTNEKSEAAKARREARLKEEERIQRLNQEKLNKRMEEAKARKMAESLKKKKPEVKQPSLGHSYSAKHSNWRL